MNPSTFYSHGKLLLSGEYLVLNGAKALAVPTKYGQRMIVQEYDGASSIEWLAFDQMGKEWFEAQLSLPPFEIIHSTNAIVAERLQKILRTTYDLNPKFWKDLSKTLRIENHIDFPNSWGLGTSSTLINNLAQWTQVNAFELLQLSFGGSGYDIACAQHAYPIFYQLENRTPMIERADFNPDFSEQLFFAYLNQKKRSDEAIKTFKAKCKPKPLQIEECSLLSQEMAIATDLISFEKLMTRHENLLSNILQMPTVKELYFKDYRGAIKSLGAWGGDFIMVTGNEKTPAYFVDKGFDTVIPFKEMILF